MSTWRAGVLVAASLTVAGCSRDGDGDGQPAARAPTDETSSVETAGPAEGDDEPALRASRDLLEDLELDRQMRHPNGTTVTVTGVEFGPTSVTVAIEAINGYTDAIRLNDLGLYLADDLENSYNFVEPETNPDLEIEPGGTVTGRLAFLGPVAADARSLTLLRNTASHTAKIDPEEQPRIETRPKFEFSGITLKR